MTLGTSPTRGTDWFVYWFRLILLCRLVSSNLNQRIRKYYNIVTITSIPIITLKNYKVIQNPGGLGSGATVRVSFLFLVTFLLFFTKKRKKVTEEFEIKERIWNQRKTLKQKLNLKINKISKIQKNLRLKKELEIKNKFSILD